MNINMSINELIDFLNAAEIAKTELRKEIKETKLKKEEELFKLFMDVVNEYYNFISPFIKKNLRLPLYLYTSPTRMDDGYQYAIRFSTQNIHDIVVCRYFCGSGMYDDAVPITAHGRMIPDFVESRKKYVSNFLRNWNSNKNFIFNSFATEIKNKYIQDLERLKKELDNLSKN